MKKFAALLILISILLLSSCKGESNSTEEITQPQLDSSEVFQILKTKAMQTAWAQLTLASVLQPTATPQPEDNHNPEEALPTAYPVEEMLPSEETVETSMQAYPPVVEETHQAEETHESGELQETPQQGNPVEETPTPTPVQFIPTFTPLSGNTLYRCAAQRLSPTVSETVPAGSGFETVWQITNTGSAVWEKNSVDLYFVDGTRLHTSVDIFDMNVDINPGDTINLTIPMRAPEQPGLYQTGWALKRGTLLYCPLNTIIQVTN